MSPISLRAHPDFFGTTEVLLNINAHPYGGRTVSILSASSSPRAKSQTLEAKLAELLKFGERTMRCRSVSMTLLLKTSMVLMRSSIHCFWNCWTTSRCRTWHFASVGCLTPTEDTPEFQPVAAELGGLSKP